VEVIHGISRSGLEGDMKTPGKRLASSNPELRATWRAKARTLPTVLSLDVHERNDAQDPQDSGVEIPAARKVCHCEVDVVEHD
jgi:hypothetical protein